MSGPWICRNDWVRKLVENIGAKSSNGGRRVLVFLPSGEVITSYSDLESKLSSLGWERYYDDPDLLQFRKRSTVDLMISVPKDFGKFTSINMYDIFLKNPNVFEVRKM